MNSQKTKKPLCVGLTGGIGTGKSTVAKIFHELGVPIIDADEIAHQITQPQTVIYQKIIEYFGDNILLEDKRLNRKKLRSLIFQNAQQKIWLENLLHPEIIKIMLKMAVETKAPYVILVIPLLAEASKLIDFLDRILVVDADLNTQIQRVITRDQSNEQEIKTIIESQAQRQQRLNIADDVIVNNGDLNTLREQVIRLHNLYILRTSKS
jgi:dephospho-CoA kinase